MSQETTPAHWDLEIDAIRRRSATFAAEGKLLVGVAVDDARKRDYFVARIQAIADGNAWAEHLTFRVVPMNGDDVVEVRRRA